MEQITSISLTKTEQEQKSTGMEKEKETQFKAFHMLLAILGFFMGQAQVGANLYLFSLIYWSMFLGYNKLLLFLVTLFCGLGLMATGNWYNIIYLLAGIGGVGINKVLKLYFKVEKGLPATIAVIYFILSFIINYYNQVLMYNYILRFGESVMIFVLISIIREGSSNISLNKRKLTITEIITLTLIVSGLLIGINNLGIAGEYTSNLINITIMVIIMGSAYKGGIYNSVLAAVIFSLVMVAAEGMSGVTMVKYILPGIFAGIFVEKGKIWMAGGLILALLTYSGLSPTFQSFQESTVEFLVTGIIFLLLPFNLFGKIYETGYEKEQVIEEENNYQPEIQEPFSELKAVFSQLSTTFAEVIKDKQDEKENRLDDFVFLFKNKNCKNCTREEICWYEEKKETYQTVKKLAEKCFNRGELEKTIIENQLRNKCVHYNKIISGVKSSFELFQLNNFWRDRLIDKQKIVSEQLSGISEMIKHFSKNADIMVSNHSKAKIKKEMEKNNIEIYGLEINSRRSSEKLNFELEIEPCAGNKLCQNKLIKFLNSRYNYNFRILEKKCGNKLKDKPCYLKYGPRGKYALDITVIQKSLNEVSGDNYLYKPLDTGNDLIVLSDGMGVGKEAARESKVAINLFESIIEANFDLQTAIKTINSALFLRNEKENFTTLDIGYFDTFSGKLQIKKIGAVSSFIKSGWDVEQVESSSLPAGILKKINVTSRTVNLNKGDFIVMLTDGLLDVKEDIENKEQWFKQLLQNSSFDRAKELAKYIMEAVIEENKEINDDLSLIVYKVDKS